MRGDDLKHLAAVALTDIEPTETELKNALADAIDVLLSLGSLGERMTLALERIATHPAIDQKGGDQPG